MIRVVGRTAAIGVVGAIVVFTATFLAATGSRADSARPHKVVAPLLAADSSTGASDSQASRLVTDLSAATTPDGRVSALNHIFDALHIGVYSGDGTPIVSGAETSSDDFYFYEPEVQMLAASLERGDRWSVDDIVAVLNGPHVLSQDITSEQLERAIANTIRDAAAHPSDPAWRRPG